MSEKDGIKGINPAALGALLRGDFENAQVAMTPGGIEEQERRGQESIVGACDALPKEVLYSTWEVIEAMGFECIGEKDDLFYRVKFPVGWTMRATDHHMWSEVVDADGHVRLRVFYKAAFYDRHAHIFVES